MWAHWPQVHMAQLQLVAGPTSPFAAAAASPFSLAWKLGQADLGKSVCLPTQLQTPAPPSATSHLPSNHTHRFSPPQAQAQG